MCVKLVTFYNEQLANDEKEDEKDGDDDDEKEEKKKCRTQNMCDSNTPVVDVCLARARLTKTKHKIQNLNTRFCVIKSIATVASLLRMQLMNIAVGNTMNWI